jgi:4'-phosphopantetheinyl transferase EntD
MFSFLLSLARCVVPPEAGVGICTVEQLQGRPVHLPELCRLSPAITSKRRHDFCAGRVAARQALEAIGMEARPVPRGPSGQPIWPAGVVGSITHSKGVAVAVALRAATGGVGVDLELRSLPFSKETRRLVLTANERNWIDSEGGPPWPLILFSAKEATYKAMPDAVRLRLGFQDVEFCRNGADSLIGASSRIPAHLAPHARYAWTQTLVLTSASSGLLH